MALNLIITDAGIAEMRNAEQSGTEKVRLTYIGLGSSKTASSKDQTAMRERFKTVSTVSGGAVGDNVIHLSVTDDSNDEYDCFEVGVYTDKNVLFGIVSSQTAIIQKSRQAQALLAIDFVITGENPNIIEVGDITVTVAPATTEVQGIVELATSAETIAGTDASRVVTPSGLSSLTATDARRGLVEIATSAETIAGTDAIRAVTPLTLRSVVPRIVGGETKPAFVKDGVVKPLSGIVGSPTQPAWLSEGSISPCRYSLNKTVPEDAKFTDTVTTVTTSGSGNAVTSITATDGAVSVKKDTTFLKSVAVSGTGNAVTAVSNSSGDVTVTKGATFVDTVSTSGSGNAITSISKSGSSALAVKSLTFVPNTGGTFTGVVNVPLPAVATDTAQIASTAYVKDCVPKSVGSANQPVYTNASGVVSACTMNSGSAVGLSRVIEQKFAVYSGDTQTNTDNNRNGYSHGYVKLANGVLIQWGCIYCASNSTVSFTYEKAYVNKPQITFSYNSGGDHLKNIRTITNTSCDFHVDSDSSAGLIKFMIIGI